MAARSLTRRERDAISTLHRTRAGVYRVGASELYIRHHPEGDWGVYSDSLDGPLRIPGAWVFPTLRQARKRAFDVAKEMGHA